MQPQGQQGYQQPSYRDIGFTQFLERQPSTYIANEQLQSYVSPFVAQVDESGFLFSPFTDTSQLTSIQQTPTSANSIQGGQLTSNNGNLTVDLTSGNINFTKDSPSKVKEICPCLKNTVF